MKKLNRRTEAVLLTALTAAVLIAFYIIALLLPESALASDRKSVV